jgi:biotin operon repressor
MLEASVRLLRLLSLPPSRRAWSGADLADRLGVTTRTVRNDLQRLRNLGYQVHSYESAYQAGARQAGWDIQRLASPGGIIDLHLRRHQHPPWE